MKNTKAKDSGVPLYQLKITLKWSKPPIWRRVVVRADMTLDRLHQVMQLVMGWSNSHLHQFVAGRTNYGMKDPDLGDLNDDTLDEGSFTVADLAPAAKAKFLYEYDFGDGWQHEVRVEKVLPPDAGFKHPICEGGANACPPEDCGGMQGYYNLLEALGDPKHPEHEELADWIVGPFDAGKFDLAGTNRHLKSLRA
ncbi:MAG: plasmid pRiA4b ORF-3 family protein [Verrucomicrobiota bacterium]